MASRDKEKLNNTALFKKALGHMDDAEGALERIQCAHTELCENGHKKKKTGDTTVLLKKTLLQSIAEKLGLSDDA